MSTRQKRKPKPKAARKKRPKAARRPVAPSRKPEKRITEARPEKAKELAPKKTFVLAVRLQGPVAVPEDTELSLRSLGLERRFNAVLLEKDESTVGMLRHAKDYLTWGEIKPEDIATLLRERAELTGGVSLTDKFVKDNFGQESIQALVTALLQGQVELTTMWQKGIKPLFRLHPPSGGFDASIKRPFGSEGELGYRGPEISNLLIRML
jgi:large subunit ribosomal protein L30